MKNSRVSSYPCKLFGIFHCAPGLEAFYTHSGWTAMTQSTTYIGTKAEPIVSNEIRMMRFLSEKGHQGRLTFEQQPLYFGEDTW